MSGVFEIFVKESFAAAHRLRGHPGDCARLHGHNWEVEVNVRCTELNGIGMGIDFCEIKSAIGNVLGGMDHADLNDLPAFGDANPTSENVARFLFRELSRFLDSGTIKVARVKVSECRGAGAVYWEE